MILTVPGLGNSGPQHWQSHWENDRDNCERVDLGVWDRPVRTLWVNKLNLAIRQYADRPVILVAHSLGCLAVAWWAQYERPAYGTPVAGASTRGRRATSTRTVAGKWSLAAACDGW
jgi:predicted alpha/beta hydrolase family esterase